MDIHFCDLCNESVPQSDLDLGLAFVRRGRIVCSNCERAMSHAEGSTPHPATEAGGVALQTEITTALDALTEGPAPANVPEPLLAHPGPDQAAYPPPAVVPGAAPLPVEGAAAPSQARSSGVALAMVALIFAAGAVAILNEQIGGIASRASGLESELRSQSQAIEELRRSAARSEEALANLEAGFGRDLGQERASAEKALADLRAEHEAVRKSAEDLGSKLGELEAAGAARDQDAAKKNDELSHRIAKSEDEGRGVLERLAKVEEGQRAPVPPASAAPTAPTASRWAALVADLQSPKAATRWEAVDQIGQAGDPEAVRFLLPMLKDTDVFVRMATARVLGDLKSVSAVPLLIDALEDAEPAVREAALGALRALTGKDLRFDPMGSESDRAKKVKAWRDWWKKTEEEGGVGKGQG